MTIMNVWELNILDFKAENLESSRSQANLLPPEQAARRASTTALEVYGDLTLPSTLQTE